jgi:3'-phosphoadenosine 5'-phosphosulfate sulfotransferase (PAPS reductase)/FAD synthetase
MKSIVSFSGGKDSTAMLLIMLEKSIKIDEIVFADTLLEFPEMYEYIDKIERHIGRSIKKIKPRKTFFDWFYGEFTKGNRVGEMCGFPKLNSHCYWSREVKDYALKRYCYGNIIHMGIAFDEAHRAKEHPKFIANYPLLEWGMTEKDCLDYLKKIDLVNPLYDIFHRTGCWLCPKQNKQSLIQLKNKYPKYWEQILKLEKESPIGFKLIPVEDFIK